MLGLTTAVALGARRQQSQCHRPSDNLRLDVHLPVGSPGVSPLQFICKGSDVYVAVDSGDVRQQTETARCV